MSIQLDKRMLVRAKQPEAVQSRTAQVAMLAKRPESFKFRLGAEPWALYILKDAIMATDKGIESFPYGKYAMMKELHK